jgi:F0F1-type ATP synthase epsilon subunit
MALGNPGYIDSSLDNGQSVRFSPSLTAGAVAQLNDSHSPPLSAGVHMLSDGTKVTVTGGGIVEKIEVDVNAAERAKQAEKRQQEKEQYARDERRDRMMSVFREIRRNK